jgi:hypothetical protein
MQSGIWLDDCLHFQGMSQPTWNMGRMFGMVNWKGSEGNLDVYQGIIMRKRT